MFCLRTINPTPHQDLWEDFDSIIREALCRILGVSINQQQWLQATLSVAVGGLGLRAASDHCFAAYIISLLSSQELKLEILGRGAEECPPVVTGDMMEGLQAKTGREDSVASLRVTTQKEVSLAIDSRNHQNLTTSIVNSENVRDKARIGSLGLPNSGAWLNVIPSPALGLHLQPREFITAVKYRLGINVFPAEGRCTACPVLSDATGDHAVSCGWGGERIARHNLIRDVLYNSCSSAALGPTREDRALLPGTEARPADILLPYWSGGKDTALDITVVNPLQTAFIHQSAEVPGHALRKAYERKMARHGDSCREVGMVFRPLPMDTLGAWSDTMVAEVKRIGSSLARHTAGEESEVIKHLVQRVAVVLARVNASMILNRAPVYASTQVDGVE